RMLTIPASKVAPDRLGQPLLRSGVSAVHNSTQLNLNVMLAIGSGKCERLTGRTRKYGHRRSRPRRRTPAADPTRSSGNLCRDDRLNSQPISDFPPLAP